MRPMHQAHPIPPVLPQPQPPVVCLTTLLGERRELVIEHGGERYRLSLTRNGKLILTK
jgi:hemin uptake protein HemP